MKTTDFTTAILVDQTPKSAFDAINDVRGWWSEEIEGDTKERGDEFTYQYEDVHRCKIKLTESVPGKKVVWLVLDNYFKFTKDTTEWTGTTVQFDIAVKDNKTEVRMTHVGLNSGYECFDICSNAWTTYIQNSLKDLITTGKGKPNGKGKPQTADKKRLAKK